MVKMARFASVGAVVGALLGVVVLGSASAARALTTKDKPAAILVWPKVVVNTSAGTNTTIQLSNTSTNLKQAHCFYVNANSHCAGNADNPGAVCQTSSDCPSGAGLAACVPGWNEMDFDIYLTQNQPLAWDASSGLSQSDLPLTTTGICNDSSNRPCTQANAAQICPSGQCIPLQSNLGTGIPPVPEDPFIGSLTCIEFDPAANPAALDQSNTLIGEATIQSTLSSPPVPTIAKYSAVGLTALGTNDNNNSLVIGGPGAEYGGCANVLLLDHVFDEVTVPFGQTTDLTLVPCGNNFLTQTPGRVTAQFLVFNEFEQRFSTSRTVDCLLDRQLSLIDTTNPTRSIFSSNVTGTLAGQTRIRGVGSADTGRGLIGVATVSFGSPAGTELAAYGLQQSGTSTQPDIITIP